MRWAFLALVAAGALDIAACGGDGDSAQPLPLEQRVVLESEAPGSEPDPVETRLTADDLDAFMALRSAGYVTATEIDRQEYEDAGFVSAINDTRFYPKRPGGPHTRDARHVRDLVLQFESDEGANTALDFLQDQGAKPCPGTCATRITEFDVDGTPGAKGLRRLTSAEELKATGAEGEPNDSWTIRFAEGPFAYEIQVFGTPGEVSEEHEAIAQKLHDRVENAPPR